MKKQSLWNLIGALIVLAFWGAAAFATPNDIIITQNNETTGTAQIQTIIPGNNGRLLGTNPLQKVISFTQAAPLTGPFWESLNVTGLPPGSGGTTRAVLADFNSPDNADGTVFLDGYISPAVISFRLASGTNGAPAAVTLGQELGQVDFFGFNSIAYTTAARSALAAFAAENWTPTSNGTYFSFYTTNVGTTVLQERMRIWPDGGIAIGTSVVGVEPGAESLHVAGVVSTVQLQVGASQSSLPTGSISYNSNVGVDIIGKPGIGSDFQVTNGVGLPAFNVPTGTTNFSVLGALAVANIPTTNQNLTPPTIGLTEVGGATAINWASGNSFTLTLNANLTTVTFTSPLSGQTIVVAITNTAGNFTVNFGNSIKWVNASQPVQTIGVTTDVWTITDLGGVLYGTVIQNMH